MFVATRSQSVCKVSHYCKCLYFVYKKRPAGKRSERTKLLPKTSQRTKGSGYVFTFTVELLFRIKNVLQCQATGNAKWRTCCSFNSLKEVAYLFFKITMLMRHLHLLCFESVLQAKEKRWWHKVQETTTTAIKCFSRRFWQCWWRSCWQWWCMRGWRWRRRQLRRRFSSQKDDGHFDGQPQTQWRVW